MRDEARELTVLLAQIHPDNAILVDRWAEALANAGGMYRAMGVEGRRALARGTIALLARALRDGAIDTAHARRFVDPPPYRNQPIDEFVLAGMLVDRMLRDFLYEQAAHPDIAALAVGQVDPLMADAIVKVVRLREERMGAGQLIADVGRLVSHGRHPRAALDAVAERVASELAADACLVWSLDEHDITLFGASQAADRLGIVSWQRVPRDDFPLLLATVEDGRHHDGLLDPARCALEDALHRTGFRRVVVWPLVTQRREVGALVLLRRQDQALEPRFEDHLQGVSPLVAAQLGYARQAGDLELADAAIGELFDASPAMMCTVDRLGRITRTNARFRREIGVPGDVVGMPLSWLVHPSWLERFTEVWDRICGQERVDQERVDLITAHSERLALSFHAHWLQDEVAPARTCMVAMTNVSKHVEQQAEDRQRIDELTAFAYHIAHDLKAPLRTIAGFTAILADELPDDVEQAVREHIERIEAATERGGELIDGLLRFARSTRGGPAKDVVHLPQLVEGVQVKLAAELADRGGSIVVTADETPLLGDAAALETLLDNLVGNALRYTDGASPRVEVSVREDGAGWASLAVRDQGVGIPEQDQQRIFKIFERGTTHQPGSGVGLAIVRRIARSYGGDVRVESEPGQGSTFYVRLPTP